VESKIWIRPAFFWPYKCIANRRTDIEVLAATMTSRGNMSQFSVLQCGTAICWLSIALAFAGTPAVAGNVPKKDVPGCSRDKKRMMWSPDDLWVALVQEEVCSDGGFVTTVTDYVQLVRRGVKPTRKNDVLLKKSMGSRITVRSSSGYHLINCRSRFPTGRL